MTATVAAAYKVRLGEANSSLLGAATGAINLNTDAIRARLHMTTTSIDTEITNVAFVTMGDFTTLGETDGDTYTAGGELINVAAGTYDSGNSRAVWASGADTVFAGHGSGGTLPSNDLAGVSTSKDVGADSVDPIISYHTGGFPKTLPGGGADVRIVWDSTGIIRIA